MFSFEAKDCPYLRIPFGDDTSPDVIITCGTDFGTDGKVDVDNEKLSETLDLIEIGLNFLFQNKRLRSYTFEFLFGMVLVLMLSSSVEQVLDAMEK